MFNKIILYKHNIFSVFTVLIVVICLFYPSSWLQAQSLSNSVQKIYIQEQKMQKVGTGFFIHPNILATNYHVVKGATNLFLLNKENPVSVSTVLAFDKQTDLVLLYSPIQGKPLSFSSSPLAYGEEVTTIGYPKGESLQKYPGIFLGWEKIHEIWHIQIHGYIIPGMSGGPVLNEQGEVVGVNRLGSFLSASRLRGAILANYLKDMLDKALDSPAFMSLDSFSDKTQTGLKLQVHQEHILITED